MEELTKIINALVDDGVSLNSDYLTNKEINRVDKFIDDLYKHLKYCENSEHYRKNENFAINACKGLRNGFRSYIESLRMKIKNRETVPNWYIQNKL
jgi:regulator of sirC expression with transglutaminase-like and TPR domain